MKNNALNVPQQSSGLQAILEGLPKLPGVLRYQDDFEDTMRSLNRYDKDDVFYITFNGLRHRVDFNTYESGHQLIAKHLFFHWIASDLSISTTYNYWSVLRDIDGEMLSELLVAGPENIKKVWSKLLAKHSEKGMLFPAVRAMLVFLARYHLVGWSPLYLEFISYTLPGPFKDKYAAVRSGDVFLTVQEESLIVNHLDSLATMAKSHLENLAIGTLEPACMLLCSYLFGMRPIQIALLTMRDIRVWQENDITHPAVHLTFKMVKQRSQSKAFPLTRRVKQEWTPLILELYRRAKAKKRSGGDRLFLVSSSQELGKAIQKLASSIVGNNVTATDLRHTAAQRLVDAGASQEEVAEFLGHADNTTCLVYYASSPNQAERVNRALGISSVYQQVIKIAHARFISPEELAELKGEQQIAGVPHGIPITGIGGCTTGQPACPYNPITSCYGCQKFMPVTDLSLHNQVLADMRSVVKLFSDTSRNDENSPAFMQLQRTVASIQAVINELEGPENA
ncbi:tyrosine-type recombinase/integrase [Acidithiobacillus sp.]|jgi:integrase|uniref:tyrosine-type recombinase/integrase n=1 Tax=Acidithiobacillus sp. TaxID=1872118 RepID=UPI0025BF8850|nr:tyrosine-type recombinase/integrase [Acidithiobacillus sp.]MCK9187845.1 tyrosine-type recombinase/integrase [Acidithiobacillus sp.]MCK9358735.1 tyrosine-type recombinase/integrase [Acidithiobacillus sp.]